MVNALPNENFAGYPHVNDDLLLPFMMDGSTPIGASFSCVYNAPNPIQNVTESALYSRFAVASVDEPPALGIGDEFYLYANPQSNESLPQTVHPVPYKYGTLTPLCMAISAYNPEPCSPHI